MLENNKKRKTSQGITYMEVAACLFVVAVIVTPLCVSLVTSTKTNVESESIRESTLKAESLLEDIKEQLTIDINDKIKDDGNSLTITDPSDLSKLKTRIEYLTTPPATNIKLKDFITSVVETDKFDAKYNTTGYAYEVALWKLDSLTPGNLTLNLDSKTLSSAIKLCSTTETNLCFDSYKSLEDLVTLKLNANMLKAFEGKLYKDSFIPDVYLNSLPVPNYNISGISTIKVKKINSDEIGAYKITQTSAGSMKINDPPLTTEVIDDPNIPSTAKDGYIFKITDSAPSVTSPQGIIILDIRDFIRNFNFKPTFKFINDASYPVVIKIPRNIIGTSETFDSIDTKYDIITEGTSKGTITLERIQDIKLQENYLIAIIIRDKQPRLGQRGKIIKKIVDVYSYASSK